MNKHYDVAIIGAGISGITGASCRQIGDGSYSGKKPALLLES